MQKKLKKLIIATHNKGKLIEFQTLLKPFGIEAISAGDLNLPEPIETGASFTENACIKAKAAVDATGLPALADDSGLCVIALNDAPGIYSARWAGDDKNFKSAMTRIQNELGEKPRSAYFISVLCLAIPNDDVSELSQASALSDTISTRFEFFEGRVDGEIVNPARGIDGFGYDPIFEPKGFHHTFGEMSEMQKNKISHRAMAFQKFAIFLEHLQ